VTTKKVVNFLGEEKCTPREKILGTRIRKGPLPYVGMGPRMVNPALGHAHTKQRTYTYLNPAIRPIKQKANRQTDKQTKKSRRETKITLNYCSCMELKIKSNNISSVIMGENPQISAYIF